MNVRGLVGAPQAMARPAMSADFVAAVRLAFAAMPPEISNRSKAANLARKVISEMLATDRREDPVELALINARAVLAPDPVLALARSAAEDLARERLRRFEDRGCRQLSVAAWDAETDEIAAQMEARLARKYRAV